MVSINIILSQGALETLTGLMLPLAETWSGVKLKHSTTYGVR